MSDFKPDYSGTQGLAKPRGFSGYMIYFDHVDNMYALLNDREVGAMNRALYEFAKNGTEPDLQKLPQKAAVLWASLRQAVIDGFTHCYDEKRKNTWNASTTGLRKLGKPTDTNAKFEFYREYADKNAHMYIRTDHYTKVKKVLEARKKIQEELAGFEDKEIKKRINPEDLPPVPHAAKGPKEGSAVEP